MRRKGSSHNKPWDEQVSDLLRAFPTANAVAEALYAEDLPRRNQARRAFEVLPHLLLGYRHYLRSTDFLAQNCERIFFIGRQEEIDSDLKILFPLLDIEDFVVPAPAVLASMRSPPVTDYGLSELATANLRTWLSADYGSTIGAWNAGTRSWRP